MRNLAWGIVVALVAIGCGSGSGGSVTAGPASTPSAPVTISIEATGVMPNAVAVTGNTQVTFMNHDSVQHQIASNPHPVHTDCPELNGPTLPAGQSFTATMGDVTKTCGFHDHLDATNPLWHGTIAVTALGGGGGGTGGSGGGY